MKESEKEEIKESRKERERERKKEREKELKNCFDKWMWRSSNKKERMNLRAGALTGHR